MDVRPVADVIELALPARAEYIGVARLLISGIAYRIGLTYDEIEDMKLAVAEACTNAAQHAYKDDEKGSIHIRCTIYEDRIVIVVADSGSGFDIASVKGKCGPIDKTVDMEDVTEGGLGLYLIHTLMDEVEISNEAGTVVSMTKYFRRDGVAGDVDAFSQSQTE
jgi:serine/threonine-protein kinase RsbW